MPASKIHLRSVRSFVRRQGRMTPGQERALTELWSHYGVEFQQQALDLTELFGRAAPSILEIGFGMGHSLAAQAQANPDYNYLGIEVHRPGIASLLAAIQVGQLTNIRVLCADAIEVLRYSVPDESLDGVQIFFPDPWPKRRHHKRRLIQTDFMQLLLAKIRAGGYIHLATDWQDYAKHMLVVLSVIPTLKNLAESDLFIARPASRPLTKFEQRGQRLGHQVWDLKFVKWE